MKPSILLFLVAFVALVGCRERHRHYTIVQEEPPITDTPQPEDPPTEDPAAPCEYDLAALDKGGDNLLRTNGLQGVLDSVTGEGRIVASVDHLTDEVDTIFELTEVEATAVIVIEIAGFKNENVLGIYDALNPSDSVVLFFGEDKKADSIELEIDNGNVYVDGIYVTTFLGNKFGFFLDSSAFERGGVFYSDSSLNPDGQDYMLAYQGDDKTTIDPPGKKFDAEAFRNDEFIIAFEDLMNNDEFTSDFDFTDMVVLVSGVRPAKICD